MTKQTKNWMLACAAVLGLGATPAMANQQNPSGSPSGSPSGTEMGSRSQLQHTTGTITAIDKSARTVTLKGEDGEKMTVDVPKDVKAFDTLKTGDKVDLDYYESLAVAMLPPGTKPSMSERTMRQRNQAAQQGMVGKETTVSAEVVSVDPAANKVTFKGPRGQTKTINVQDPAMQAKLPNLKPGQVVQFTYTEALAASLRPSSK
jgi:Cu/Ag efflux protein CusF